jgi:response regulator of citrate/malate metabolism
VKTPSVLLLACAIPICALGQASNMISISTLQQESAVATAYTRTDIKHLVKTAQTTDEFERLTDYFDRQAEDYAAKNEAEQKELDRLLALRYHARSYPAQVEGTRNRIDHFKALSHKCSEQAALYRARVRAADTPSPGTSSPQ